MLLFSRRRRLRAVTALGLAGVVCGLGLTGCAQFDKALGQQQALIYFAESTPVSYKLMVRKACNHVTPNVVAAPIATDVPLSSAVDVVTYNTTGSSDVDIAKLGVCVDKFQPQVVGMTTQDSSDDS